MEDHRKFRNIDIEERRRDLLEIINRRARRSGSDLPADVKTFIIDIEEMILGQFPYVTMSEVEKSLENGFSDKYNIKMKSGIYADKIIAYIRAHREELGYYSRINAHAQEDVQAPSLVTADNIKTYVIYCYQCYVDWKRGGREPYIKANLPYDALYHMGVIGLDTPPMEYLKRAEDMETANRLEQHMMGMINLNFAAELTLEDEGIVNIAKKMYLYDWFESLIMQGVTIDKVLADAIVPQKYVNIRNYELTH